MGIDGIGSDTDGGSLSARASSPGATSSDTKRRVTTGASATAVGRIGPAGGTARATGGSVVAEARGATISDATSWKGSAATGTCGRGSAAGAAGAGSVPSDARAVVASAGAEAGTGRAAGRGAADVADARVVASFAASSAVRARTTRSNAPARGSPTAWAAWAAHRCASTRSGCAWITVVACVSASAQWPPSTRCPTRSRRSSTLSGEVETAVSRPAMSSDLSLWVAAIDGCIG